MSPSYGKARANRIGADESEVFDELVEVARRPIALEAAHARWCSGTKHKIGHRPNQRIDAVGAAPSLIRRAKTAHLIFELSKAAKMPDQTPLI